MRRKIDLGFRAYAALVIRYKWASVLLLLLLSGLMLSGMPKLHFDTSTEGFFRPDDPNMIRYEAFRDQFGRDDIAFMLLEPKEVFSSSFLKTLQAMHQEIEERLPNLEDINSLINARKTVGKEGALIVGDLLEEMPQTPEEMADLKNYVLHQPLYENFLISTDAKVTAIAIQMGTYSTEGVAVDSDFDLDTTSQAPSAQKPLSDHEITQIVKVLHEIKEKYQGPDLQIYVTGSPVVTDYLKATMQKDMPRFLLSMVGLIAVFLFLTFRRFSGVLLPLLTVLLSLGYTLGLMGHLGVSVKLPTMILPSFILAVGIGSSVHIMSMFYKDFVKEKGNKEKAIQDALEHSGLPVAMTSITTAAGLLSFAGADVAPIADLGRASSFGVMVALFMTITLIPSFLAILPVRSLKKSDYSNEVSTVDRILMKFGDWSYDHAAKVVGIAALIGLMAVAGLFRLQFSHDIMKWYPEGSEVRIANEKIDQSLGGSVNIEMVVDAGKENGQYDPELQVALDELATYALNVTNNQGKRVIHKTTSLSSMLKEINQALHENKKEFYEVPPDREMIAQELLLFENSGSDDIENISDSLFSKSRFSAKSQWQDAAGYHIVIEQIRTKANELIGDKAQVGFTGLMVLFAETVTLMMNTMIQSYLIAFALITLLMILLIGRISTGLLSMIPNFFPILLTLGLMGWLGIPLDMFTLLIGSIAIGLAVDDTIHFFHNFRKVYVETGSVRQAIDTTLLTAGRAMLVTSVVLTLGFFIFMFATLNNLFSFGLLTGFTLITAFLADILLAPALLTLTRGKT